MKLFFTLATILILSNIGLSQTIQGTITDETNIGLEWANIINITQGTHTHSGPDGIYKFKNCEIGDSVAISFLGYESKSFQVEENKSTYDFELKVKTVSIEEVVIAPQVDALHLFTDINLKTNPVSSSQEILKQVPGLFIGQHAGGGKAEQLFLRGFDIDHGTDIAIAVDDLPVNMVSHAHGQGYADLHFLIPETIESIDFGKGSYDVKKGNFTTAGHVTFNTIDRLKSNIIKVESGQFNTNRLLTQFTILDQKKQSAYFSGEYLSSDGYFESPQNFSRKNVFGKYINSISDSNRIEFTISHFTSQWDASGQIPLRSVVDNSITRFGAIDDTEGGMTSRTNISLNHRKTISTNTFINNSIFYSNYNFELFSNFTFFLNDPINGDQIRQFENRNILGFNSTLNSNAQIGSVNFDYRVGVSLRNDKVNDNELSNTVNRSEIINYVKYGDVEESNLGIFANGDWTFGDFQINGGIRFDYFRFEYLDKLSQTYDNSSLSTSIILPKINFIYNKNNNLQYYIKMGKGFHSNDARVVIAQNGEKTLPSAYSIDGGFIWKPTADILLNASIWNLYLEQEFVYVGDEGVVEPSGKSNRKGLDLSLRYQPLQWLYLNYDANYTIAKSIESEAGEDFIPLAPDLTMTLGLNFLHPSGFFGGLNVRHLNDRPANEDNSIVAEGYTITDINMGYQWKNVSIGFQILNLFDRQWNETQFATNSRLFDEVEAVEEIHFTPGTPFNIKGNISYKF
ncbi:MAG: TonB-dependent receptor plug domain-containing protein [Saprospiraceae bacterium]|nr:TonB-dependent receptor [Bacteroidia bacterium]NNE16210.1 TonB-dependent receptor plug domain-containing protein [Saprospiraceae bacterium]NNL91971.1 TonB-dependent receptor plug domain-containing protein [Saprospiraceae bacterium]